MPQPDGSTITQIHVELRKLPAPERSYVADLAGVEPSEDGFRILFAQERRDGQGIRSLVIVSVSVECVRSFLNASETFWPTLNEFVEKNGASVDAAAFRPKTEPEHVVSLRANMIAGAYSAREAELQFFHFAPFSIHKMQSLREEPAVDPVVRVHLSTARLHGMLKLLLEAKLPEDWK